MRAKRACQLPLTIDLGAHEHVAELREISRILDAEPGIADAAHAVLTKGRRADRGRGGLSADQVVRATVLYKLHDWTFRELAFELQFNEAYRSFCRFELGQRPRRSTLHRDVRAISATVWESINQILLAHAARQGIEDGAVVRADCTVTETDIHHPTDSSLLWDCVRKLTDLLDDARRLVKVNYANHRKVAKRRSLAISNAKRMKDRVPLYRDLIAVTRKAIGYARRTISALRQRHHPSALILELRITHFVDLSSRVVEQAERRVLRGESVPAQEKIVSIFEEHTDVIRKGGRETLYGHKLCLSTGSSNLITDCLILGGNPPDSSLVAEVVQRHASAFGAPPRQAAFDGGFASKENLETLKSFGVRDVMFHKKVGLRVADMVSKSWIYSKLRRFRAGIEGVISLLKRCFGAGRARWKGKRGFQACVWSSVVAANLLVLARHALD